MTGVELEKESKKERRDRKKEPKRQRSKSEREEKMKKKVLFVTEKKLNKGSRVKGIHTREGPIFLQNW